MSIRMEGALESSVATGFWDGGFYHILSDEAL